MAKKPSGTTPKASGMAWEASGMPNKPSGMAAEASGMTKEPSGMATKPSGMASQPSGMGSEPSGIAWQPSGMKCADSGNQLVTTNVLFLEMRRVFAGRPAFPATEPSAFPMEAETSAARRVEELVLGGDLDGPRAFSGAGGRSFGSFQVRTIHSFSTISTRMETISEPSMLSERRPIMRIVVGPSNTGRKEKRSSYASLSCPSTTSTSFCPWPAM